MQKKIKLITVFLFLLFFSQLLPSSKANANQCTTANPNQCLCDLNGHGVTDTGSDGRPLGNGKTAAEQAFVCDGLIENRTACGTIRYCDNNGNATTASGNYTASVCDQSLADLGRNNPCVNITSLYCKCDHPGSSTQTSFGCWSVDPGTTNNGPDFKRACGNGETCSSAPFTRGWPCSQSANPDGQSCTGSTGLSGVCHATCDTNIDTDTALNCGALFCCVHNSSTQPTSTTAPGQPTNTPGPGQPPPTSPPNTCIYYTQPNQCSSPLIGTTSQGHISGHTYLIHKCGSAFNCVADCTAGVGTNLDHCPSNSTAPTATPQPPAATSTPKPAQSTPTPTTAPGQPTNTTAPAQPTSTPVPTGIPPTQPNIATVAIKLDSIDSQDQKNQRVPKHKTRIVTIFLYKDQSFTNDPQGVKATKKITGTVFFTKGDTTKPETYGIFLGQTSGSSFDFKGVSKGDYFVFAKTEGSLRLPLGDIPQKTPIDISQGVVLDFTENGLRSLPMGDLNNDNQLTIDDFNFITTCYNFPNDASKVSSCKNLTGVFDSIFTTIPIVDLNDDGSIDGIDLNVFLRNYRNNSSGF